MASGDIEILRSMVCRSRCSTALASPRRVGARHTQDKFVGALRLPGDETGDCFEFTNRLAELAQALGARFRFGTRIDALSAANGKVDAIRLDGGTLEADAYVCALGSHSPLLLAPIGIDIPVYPVKGYSITVPIEDAAYSPESTIMDETHKVAVTRLGRFAMAALRSLRLQHEALRAARRWNTW
jgi:D-amino-acid dehydrogenase